MNKGPRPLRVLIIEDEPILLVTVRDWLQGEGYAVTRRRREPGGSRLSASTVFITGESGTGKELIAEAIHGQSERARRKFVAINCAAIPKDLLESELFGHEKGSFTGATARYIGCCEQAHGGTLFLDEICEMDINLQTKLLRFLQERTFHRVGGNETIHVDVRILAATNRRPMEEIGSGKLREDLYYRLNVVPIDMPPLRERREDIPVLANSFLERAAAKYDKYFYDFAPEAMATLIDYGWPGNVREMENRT
jgi:transcriptional regulator with PAS, ATPase and Fis domain